MVQDRRALDFTALSLMVLLDSRQRAAPRLGACARHRTAVRRRIRHCLRRPGARWAA